MGVTYWIIQSRIVQRGDGLYLQRWTESNDGIKKNSEVKIIGDIPVVHWNLLYNKNNDQAVADADGVAIEVEPTGIYKEMRDKSLEEINNRAKIAHFS